MMRNAKAERTCGICSGMSKALFVFIIHPYTSRLSNYNFRPKAMNAFFFYPRHVCIRVQG
jgi:hypothetical protein